MAGYSGTPLSRKLGLRPGMRAWFAGAPENYPALLGPVFDELMVLRRPGRQLDFIQLFCRSRKELARRLPGAHRALALQGMLWISWPKKSSGLQADLAEADVRAAGLQAGLVDIKICAVDDTWSGLKFTYRRADRDRQLSG